VLTAGEDAVRAVREYIDRNLPKGYTGSPLYALEVREDGGVCTAEVILDMSGDGSDYTGLGEDDLMILAELEAGYLLGGPLKEPPAPTDFLLRMRFEEEILVERRWGRDWGTLTYGAAKMNIDFDE